MIIKLPNGLFPFQREASLKLLDITSNEKSKQTVVMKSPTGSGKTLILIDFIDEYLYNVNNKTAFIWLCPGKGNLEEQSREKMDKYGAQRSTQNLFEALLNGFTAESTTFINWELVTKTGNKAITEGEKKNLFDRIAEAHRAGISFIVIIDEEHSNNTAKANTIINAFSPKHVVRVSATAISNSRFEYFEIDETDVIDEGLITSAIYVNAGVEDGMEIKDDFDCLLELADKKRKEIALRYKEKVTDKIIRPLVLIQFPNGQPETIEAVEKKLADMGYTYDNGMVSKWMSEDKRDLTADLTKNDGTPVFLLMKQAISTGWDCPRAKILVKLREGMSESFQIQTIGRIRRMPEAKHYNDDLLDFCYVYTFDEKFKAGMLQEEDRAYIPRRLFLKEKCKSFELEKQIESTQYGGLGERDVLQKIYNYYVTKYKLGKDKEQNKKLLHELGGYIFGDKIINKFVGGVYVLTDSLSESDEYKTAYKNVDRRNHRIYLLHSLENISKSILMQRDSLQVILERLFRKQFAISPHKLVSLDTREYLAFIVNNERLIKNDLDTVTGEIIEQLSFKTKPQKFTFKIPEQCFYKYDPSVKNETEYSKNAYEGYTSGFATSVVRSVCELLFEQHCESREDIDWVYKNGDSGQQYFSIVYYQGMGKQRLFYADYIVKKKDGTIWVIETKGGESKGKDKNIDKQIANKFIAFKQYAEEHNLHWGFVRDKDNALYINNTEFCEDMADEHWVPLKEVF